MADANGVVAADATSAPQPPDLATWTTEEILNDEHNGHQVTLLGRFQHQPQGERSILKFLAQSLPSDVLLTLRERVGLVSKGENNAQYSQYVGVLSPECLQTASESVTYAVSVITNVDQRTINRNRPAEARVIVETAALYTAVTLPHIQQVTADESKLDWVWNILSGEKETERVIFTDTQQESAFLMIVDTKWRGYFKMQEQPQAEWPQHPSIKDLYCLAIAQDRTLRSMRDLRGSHLPLLRSIYSNGIQTIKSKFGVDETQLRIFVHYQPQYYHFHVHFSRSHNDYGRVYVEDAHLLLDIIQNLESDPTYYVNRTIVYKLKVNDDLYKKISSHQETQESPCEASQNR